MGPFWTFSMRMPSIVELLNFMHPNGINPAESWRHIALSRWRKRRGNFTSDFVFWWLRSIRKVEIYLPTKFRRDISIHAAEILLLPVSENQRPPCSNFTFGFDYHVCVTIGICHSASAYQISSEWDDPWHNYGGIGKEGWKGRGSPRVGPQPLCSKSWKKYPHLPYGRVYNIIVQTRRVQGHPRSMVVVPIGSPLVVCRLTSIVSNIASLTVFEIYDAEVRWPRSRTA